MCVCQLDEENNIGIGDVVVGRVVLYGRAESGKTVLVEEKDIAVEEIDGVLAWVSVDAARSG